MTYLQWLLFFMGIPIAVFLLLDKQIFLKNWQIFARTALGSLFFAYLWDLISIKTRIWYFPEGLMQKYFLGLPVEEYIFIIGAAIGITYATLYLMKHYVKN